MTNQENKIHPSDMYVGMLVFSKNGQCGMITSINMNGHNCVRVKWELGNSSSVWHDIESLYRTSNFPFEAPPTDEMFYLAKAMQFFGPWSKSEMELYIVQNNITDAEYFPASCLKKLKVETKTTVTF